MKNDTLLCEGGREEKFWGIVKILENRKKSVLYYSTYYTYSEKIESGFAAILAGTTEAN